MNLAEPSQEYILSITILDSKKVLRLMTTVAGKAISFKAAMVQAILADRKTQTRRLFSPQPMVTPAAAQYAAKYGPVGLRLWVKEAWATESQYDALPPRELPDGARIWYLADGPKPGWCGRDRNAMFCMRRFSRIELEVTELQAERLQQITEEDAVAEGIEALGCEIEDGLCWWNGREIPVGLNADNGDHPTDVYAALWDCINTEEGVRWDADPWVQVVCFKVIAKERVGVQVKAE
jgi:hypothetical protein